MFNLRINRKEYDSLIDMCSIALMVAHNAGAEGEHIRGMVAMFNELVNMSHDRDSLISDKKLDFLQDKYYFPSCLTFYKNMTEELPVAVQVISSSKK